MVAVPYPYPSNITGFMGLVYYANNASNGMFGMGLLLAVALITFLTTKAYSYERAIGVSSFLAFIVAILLRFMALINDGVFFVCIVYLIVGIVLLWIEREKETG